MKRVSNTFRIEGDIARMQVNRLNGEKWTAAFNADDIALVSRHHWFVTNYNGDDYAMVTEDASGSRRTLAKVILESSIGELPRGTKAGHVNGDTLDCRRSNIRAMTWSEAADKRPDRTAKRSGFPGVTWSKIHRAWQARLWTTDPKMPTAKRRRTIGYFDEPAAAAAAIEARRFSEGISHPIGE